MKKASIHILHLDATSLRWATLEGGRHAPTLAGTGTLIGDPAECLEKWIQPRKEEPGEIFLFDARTIYFSFSIHIPKKALKQADSILRVKIREELGLGDDAVRWAARPESSANAPDQVDLFTVVARREGLEDLNEWKKRYELDALWVGADLTAIRSIVLNKLAPPPFLIVNAGERGATFYHAGEKNRILRDYTEFPNGKSAGETNGTAFVFAHGQAESWEAVSRRLDFGSREKIRHFETSRLNLPIRAELDIGRLREHEPRAGELLSRHAAELAQFDAVILGGILETVVHRPVTPSLLEEAPRSFAIAQFTKHLNMRKLVPASGLVLLLLLASLWAVRSVRSSARDRLNARADALAADTKTLRSQEAVLQKIKADRSPLIPVLEEIHKAAPENTNVMSLDIGESGVVQVAATAQDEGAATAFFKALSAVPQFEKVQLANMKFDPQKRIVSFQLTWEIKGRKKR